MYCYDLGRWCWHRTPFRAPADSNLRSQFGGLSKSNRRLLTNFIEPYVPQSRCFDSRAPCDMRKTYSRTDQLSDGHSSLVQPIMASFVRVPVLPWKSVYITNPHLRNISGQLKKRPCQSTELKLTFQYTLVKYSKIAIGLSANSALESIQRCGYHGTTGVLNAMKNDNNVLMSGWT